MPKKTTHVRKPWTKEDLRQLKAHSKTRTPVVEVAKAMKRTEAAVRQKAKTIGVGLGHRRWACFTRAFHPVRVTRWPLIPLSRRPESTDLLPSRDPDGPLFVTFLLAVVVVVTLLQFLPALALGPIAEHFLAGQGATF
jgi:hypothetical protein